MTGDVFLVDDNPNNLTLLAGILRAAGYRVRAANAGKRALSMMQAQLPDLVMLDITMPEMDGYEVCQALKAEGATRQVPVIFISALDDPLDKVKAFKTGGVDYVTKPFHAEEVIARVENQLKVSRFQRELAEKNSEMQKVNEQLRAAQQRIVQLLGSAPGASDSVSSWSRNVCDRLARDLGAAEIAIWEIEDEKLTPLWETRLDPPALDLVRAAVQARARYFSDGGGGMAVPVLGPSKDLCGVILVNERVSDWGDLERQLVNSFSHQLGGAFEMSKMRRRLAAAEERKSASRRELHDKGIATVQICPLCGLCFDHQVQKCSADGARLEALGVLPFVLLGRYQLERILGKGGMGIVFSAHDEKLDRPVAIKLIRPDHFGNREMKERFEREARLVARIQHPGVVNLFDSGELEDGTAFLVMEKLGGHSLRALLRRSGPGTPRQVSALVRQGAAALGAAHRAGVVHRDIKPENVFLGEAPEGFRVKILDFGIAKRMAGEQGITNSGALVGTPHYMPPEQIQGQEADARSDLYSFAAVCYEALTGQRAVRHEGFANVMLEVLGSLPESVSGLVPGVPSAVDKAFAQAFEKDPGRRSIPLEIWAATVADALDTLPERPDAGWASGWHARSSDEDSPALDRSTITVSRPRDGAADEQVTS